MTCRESKRILTIFATVHLSTYIATDEVITDHGMFRTPQEPCALNRSGRGLYCNFIYSILDAVLTQFGNFLHSTSIMPVVQFAPFSSLVQPSFWHKLTGLKVDVHKLNDDAIPLFASYTPGRSIKDRETGQDIALACNLTVGEEGFESQYE